MSNIGVGMLGYAFMGKAHANAYRTLPYIVWPPPLEPQLVAIAGRDEPAVGEAARRYGFARAATDWRSLVDDPEIGLFDNCGPNDLHGEPTIAAAEAGKHVFCEKPLGRDAGEAYEIWQHARAAGVVHMCAFNYRFVPAVRRARQLMEAGELGTIHHFRGRYLQDWGAGAGLGLWRFDKAAAGSGALGDLGSHVFDLARYLVGDIHAVAGAVRTFAEGRSVDDAFAATVEFANGALGTVEASRFATGRKNALSWEINGANGSLAFDLERPNELLQSNGDGFRTILVTEPDDPFVEWWWPPGHVIGWEHTFVHEIEHLLGAIAGRNEVAPHGATFEDGYRAAELGDAVLRSAETGRREAVTYR